MSVYSCGRIIPKACGVWDADKAYERLSIVFYPVSGSSYMSRKDTPAGTPLTDTDYWALCFETPSAAPSSVYYGTVTKTPTSVSVIEAMEQSDKCTFTIEAGIYCIACAVQIKRIRDKNELDVTDDFTETQLEGYYVYTFGHRAVIPMEFTVYFA